MRRALLLLAVLAAGCPSTTVYRSADPVEPGRWQLHGGLGAGAWRDTEQETRLPVGSFELGARRGLRDDLDLGVSLYTFGAAIDATWRFHRGPTWSLAVAPSLSGARLAETAVTTDSINLFAGATLIASRPLSRCWTLALGPSLGWGLYWPETGGHAQGGWLGGFVGADRRLGARWHFTPELGLFRVFAGEVPVKGGGIQLGAAARVDL